MCIRFVRDVLIFAYINRCANFVLLMKFFFVQTDSIKKAARHFLVWLPGVKISRMLFAFMFTSLFNDLSACAIEVQ